jgi:hypothetical protein
MSARYCIRAGCWAAGLFALAAGTAAAQEPTKPSAPAAEANDFVVVALKYTRALDLSQILQLALNSNRPGAAVRIIADPRTNSILVTGTAAEINQVKDLIRKLDTPQAESDVPLRLHVYQLQSIEPDKAVEDALRLVFKGGGGNFSLDRQRKQVIVYANEATVKTAEALLMRLEQQAHVRPEPNVQVRVVWLVNGPAREDAPQPPDDLKDVLPTLAKMAIDRPRLAAQAMVNVTPNVEFQAKGVAKLDAPCDFSVTGRLTDKQEMPRLQITIRATRQGVGRGGTPVSVDLCNLQTEISAPPGHLVVLGMTPTDTLTSVFVVQVVGQNAKQPGQKK